MSLPVFSQGTINIVLKVDRRLTFCPKLAQQIRVLAVQASWAEFNPWTPYNGIKRELTQRSYLLTYTDTDTQ